MPKALALAALAAVLCAPGVAAANPKNAAGKAGKPGKTGTIEATVAYQGTPPVAAALDRSRDPQCTPKQIPDEAVVVLDGKLRDVLVRLPNGAAGKHPPPTTSALIDQTGCMYRPRVVGLVAGQKLAVRNGDQTFHNVRGTREGDTQFNLAQPAGAPDIIRAELGKPGDVITFHCDVHPWMRAYAVVHDHPFFAVTAADGRVTLEDVPAGTYALEAWHPTLGRSTQKVTVQPGKTSKVTFTYRP